VCQANNPADAIVESVWRPRAVAALRCVGSPWLLAEGQTAPVLFGRRSPASGSRASRASRVELSFSASVLVAVKIEEEATMGRGLLLWLIGIPIPIILLIWLFGGLHG
jgi:hypothetical protein